MGKKSKGSSGNLGKALIRDRFRSPKFKRNKDDPSMLHSVEINDGYDWGRLNLQSITEESSFQEFLSTAELAGTEFHAEKLNIKFINPKSGIGLLSKDEKEKVLESQEKNKSFLKIPRRPRWDSSTTPCELQTREKEEFLEWRRNLAILQETEGLILTPYEKNLEFWRQLWRVVERSDIIIQIVDARHPLLFRCEDLENYVKEVNSEKMNMILVNKSDFLTESQRKIWANYFTSIKMKVAFFSATLATEKHKIEEESEEKEEEVEVAEEGEEEEEEKERTDGKKETGVEKNDVDEKDEELGGESETSNAESLYTSEFASNTEYESADDGVIRNESFKENSLEGIHNSSELLNRDELVKLLKTIYKGKTYVQGVTTIGLVGYPNVGKSSTINALLKNKKVSVSATPGKTKHFQTLFLDKDLLLCDCPGLVMPSFVCTKSDMILNGILPIDQMRDHVPPITLLGTLIPRHIIEDLYGIMLPQPLDGEDPNRAPTAEEILNAYGYNRGFMTQNGQPDNPRSARYVLKDFVNGRLLHCVAPPSAEQEKYHTFPSQKRIVSENKHLPSRMIRVNNPNRVTAAELDKGFFRHSVPGVHVKGIHGRVLNSPQSLTLNDVRTITGSMQSLLLEEKPWKKTNKHVNKKKREKTRRLYAHLDQH